MTHQSKITFPHILLGFLFSALLVYSLIPNIIAETNAAEFYAAQLLQSPTPDFTPADDLDVPEFPDSADVGPISDPDSLQPLPTHRTREPHRQARRKPDLEDPVLSFKTSQEPSKRILTYPDAICRLYPAVPIIYQVSDTDTLSLIHPPDSSTTTANEPSPESASGWTVLSFC